MQKKTIYLLIGPKGSGKSYIGTLFQQYFGISFLPVEGWIKDVPNAGGLEDESYLDLVFSIIEEGVLSALDDSDAVVFESTGLTPFFDRMLTSLRSKADVILVQVTAPPGVCLQRIKSRDQSMHRSFLASEIANINEKVVSKSHVFDYRLDNTEKSADELRASIKALVGEKS